MLYVSTEYYFIFTSVIMVFIIIAVGDRIPPGTATSEQAIAAAAAAAL